MSHTPHDLSEEFPEYVHKIRYLREADGHFSRIYSEYHELNGQVHRMETNVEPTDDFAMETARKKRMLLKDEIYGMLSAPEKGAKAS